MRFAYDDRVMERKNSIPSVQKNPDPECFVTGRQIILSIIRKRESVTSSVLYDIHLESRHVVMYEGWSTSAPFHQVPTSKTKTKNYAIDSSPEDITFTFFVGKENGCGYMECWKRFDGGWNVFTCFDSTRHTIFDLKVDLYLDDTFSDLKMTNDQTLFKMDKRSLSPYTSDDFMNHEMASSVEADFEEVHGLVFSKLEKEQRFMMSSSRKSEIGSVLGHVSDKVLITRMRKPSLLFLVDCISRDFVPSEALVLFRLKVASVVLISLWCACVYPYTLNQELTEKTSLLLSTLFMENEMCDYAHKCMDKIRFELKRVSTVFEPEYQITLLRPLIREGEEIVRDLFFGKEIVSYEKILLMKKSFFQVIRSKIDPYPNACRILKGEEVFSCLGVNYIRHDKVCSCCNKHSSSILSLLNHESKICTMCEDAVCDSCMNHSLCRICLAPSINLIETSLLQNEIRDLEKRCAAADVSKRLFMKEREKNKLLQGDLEECRRTSNSVTIELEQMQEKVEKAMKNQKTNLKNGERMKKLESENARFKNEMKRLEREDSSKKKVDLKESILQKEIYDWMSRVKTCEQALGVKEEEMKRSDLQTVFFKEKMESIMRSSEEEENNLLQKLVMEKKKSTSLEKKVYEMSLKCDDAQKKSDEMEATIQVFQSSLKNIDQPDAELWRRRYEELYFSVKRKDPTFFQS